MSWHDGRLCAFDLETTSANPEDARIVQFAVAYVGDGEPTTSASTLVNPGVPIPSEATAIHGITDERAATGLSALEATRRLSDVLSLNATAMPLVIFNARFDLTVVDRECRRHGVEPPNWSQVLVIDPFVIDRHLDRYRKGSRKLDAMCEHYRATLDGAHDAENDALAAARLAWVLAKRGQVVRRVRDAKEQQELEALVHEWDEVRNDLPALHAAQVRWAAEQAEGLEAHFKRQGRDEHVAREWPVTIRAFGCPAMATPVNVE